MAIPNKATGYGDNSTARNVFGCTFSQALSSAVKYECYDNDQTFPATDTQTSTTNDVLAGTAGNGSKSMVGLVDTTDAAPTALWFPSSATGGEANPNRMKGQTSYVQQDGANRTAGQRITWNECIEIPSDVTPSSTMGYDLLLRYTYTGSAPSLTWEFNENTEGSPTWTSLTPNTQHGLRHCNSGTSAGGPYVLDIPPTGTSKSSEGWITA